jgi:hypothetical protein
VPVTIWFGIHFVEGFCVTDASPRQRAGDNLEEQLAGLNTHVNARVQVRIDERCHYDA